MKRLITLSLICLSLVAKASVPFDHIVDFGDSLSDDGNAFERTQHFVPQTPPYFQGRFSNGPVWVEHIATMLSSKPGFLQNYALGGAGVTAEDEDIDGVFTLANQVKDYLNENNQIANENNLYIIWIGANNYLILPEDEKEAVNKVKIGTGKALDKLLKAGAKHFLVLNLPDLSRTPFAKSVSDVEREKLARYTNQHNQMIKELISDYQAHYPKAHLYFYDANLMFNRAVDHPEEFGLSNSQDTCFEDDLSATVAMEPVIRIEKRFNMNKLHNCDAFLFFDPVHPTAKAHQIMAKEIFSSLAEVFEPKSRT